MLKISTKFEVILKKLKLFVILGLLSNIRFLIDNLHYYGVGMYEIY